MRLTRVAIASRRRSAAHPALEDDGPDLAVAAEVAPEGDVLLRVTFRAPARLLAAYRALPEAVAILVDLPDLGLCESSVLTDAERLGDGPSWLGLGPAAADDAAVGGWLTARLGLAPEVERPATLHVRAALREACSRACRVDLP